MKTILKSGDGKKILDNAIKNLKGSVGKVGWFPSAKYPDGTPVAYAAASNEFGNPSKNIPARSTMRPTNALKQNDWSNLMRQGAQKVMSGKWSSADLMEAIGATAAGDYREAITTLWDPPLAEATIQARERKKVKKKKKRNKPGQAGITKPLVDTGLMLASLTNVVEKS